MNRPEWSSPAAVAQVPASESGVLLGLRRGKPVTVRLFRPQGCRIVVLGNLRIAQLIALRAAAAGARLEVATTRRQLWQSAAARTPDSLIGAHGTLLPAIGSAFRPVLIVDDRGDELSGAGDAASWQCRLDLRAVPDVAGLAQYGGADLLLLGQVPLEVAAAVVAMFHLDPASDGALAGLPADGVAAIRRGGVQLLGTAETADETAALGARLAAAAAMPRRSVVTEADPRTVPPWAVRELAALRVQALSPEPVPEPASEPTEEPAEEPADLDDRTVPRWAVEQLRRELGSVAGPDEPVDPHHGQ